MSALAVATTIFVITYAVIISERLVRSVVALTCGALMSTFGILDQEKVVEEIGPLDTIAREAANITGSNALLTALVLISLAGITSAIIDNIPAVATPIPLVFWVSRLLVPDLAGHDGVAFVSDSNGRLLGGRLRSALFSAEMAHSKGCPHMCSRLALRSAAASRFDSGASRALARRSPSCLSYSRASIFGGGTLRFSIGERHEHVADGSSAWVGRGSAMNDGMRTC